MREGLVRQLARRREMMAEGAVSVGWKVGFGAPASLEVMEITAPLLGFLTDATLLDSGALVDTSTWERGVVEFEVAVYLGRDLGPGTSEGQARAAVSAVGAAIELANIDLAPGPSRVADVVAGDIFHKAVILGEPDKGRSGLDITSLVARVIVDETEVATTTQLEAITGAYPWVVATVANTLASSGEMLRAGDVIITGSVIPPIPVADGAQFTFTLDPLESLSVRVA